MDLHFLGPPRPRSRSYRGGMHARPRPYKRRSEVQVLQPLPAVPAFAAHSCSKTGHGAPQLTNREPHSRDKAEAAGAAARLEVKDEDDKDEEEAQSWARSGSPSLRSSSRLRKEPRS